MANNENKAESLPHPSTASPPPAFPHPHTAMHTLVCLHMPLFSMESDKLQWRHHGLPSRSNRPCATLDQALLSDLDHKLRTQDMRQKL